MLDLLSASAEYQELVGKGEEEEEDGTRWQGRRGGTHEKNDIILVVFWQVRFLDMYSLLGQTALCVVSHAYGSETSVKIIKNEVVCG